GVPYGLAVAIDCNAVRAAPRSAVDLCPIANDGVWIRAAVHGRHFVGLRGASADGWWLRDAACWSCLLRHYRFESGFLDHRIVRGPGEPLNEGLRSFGLL